MSGIDGSGKSTIAKAMAKHLSKKGFATNIIWFRWRALLLYIVYFISRVKGLYRSVRLLNGRNVRIHLTEADKALATLYSYVLLLDLIIFYFLQRVVNYFKNVVIYDRSPLDALIDVYYIRYRSGLRLGNLILKLYLSFALRITKCIIVLDATEDVILARKRDIVSLREIVFKRRLYNALSRALGLPLIDTSNRDIASTLKDVLAHVKTSTGYRGSLGLV